MAWCGVFGGSKRRQDKAREEKRREGKEVSITGDDKEVMSCGTRVMTSARATNTPLFKVLESGPRLVLEEF